MWIMSWSLVICIIVIASCLGEPQDKWTMVGQNSPVVKGNPCLIVVHDTIKGYLNWHFDWFIARAKQSGVTITEDKSQAGKADVFLYHAPQHRNYVNKDAIKNKHAILAMISMEQPKYATVLQEKTYLEKNIDLLITYSLSSYYTGTKVPNLPITYYPSHIVPATAVQGPHKSFRDKTGFGTGVSVAVFASNCGNAGAKLRTKYLEELMSYIPIHSYGRCMNNRVEPEIPYDPKWPSIAQRRARKLNVLSQYRFYLAFENAPIEDYVSEKVFEGLLAGTLPIYRGAPGINNFMPSPKSFINANELTPRQLADEILRINASEAIYQEYMEYKQHPLPDSFYQISNMSYVHPNVVRRICDKADQLRKGRQ